MRGNQPISDRLRSSYTSYLVLPSFSRSLFPFHLVRTYLYRVSLVSLGFTWFFIIYDRVSLLASNDEFWWNFIQLSRPIFPASIHQQPNMMSLALPIDNANVIIDVPQRNSEASSRNFTRAGPSSVADISVKLGKTRSNSVKLGNSNLD